MATNITYPDAFKEKEGARCCILLHDIPSCYDTKEVEKSVKSETMSEDISDVQLLSPSAYGSRDAAVSISSGTYSNNVHVYCLPL